ncbi:MAG: M28 family metallopeptidase, partial [Glaciecola sp.]
PAGDDGTYMQRITFRNASLVQESPTMVIDYGDETVALDYPKDFLTGKSMLETESAVTAEMVFVGFGVVSEEYGIDDYAGLDVEGKIVVRVPGRHASLPNEEGAHISSSRERERYAVERGAVGMITVQTPKSEENRPYSRSLNYIHSVSMDWLDKDGKASKASPQMKGSALLNLETSKLLFAKAPKTLEDVWASMEGDVSPTGFELNASVTLTKESSHKDITSPNVVGIVEGSDPVLKNEYVLYSAHSDHLGVSKSVEKDRINNGAMDNAGGTAIMLETARMFASLPVKPKRSILFVAVTAEEKGLLGSDYYAQIPTVPAENIVANVNLDMPILTFDFADVIAFGAEHSSMQQYVADATASQGIALTDDPWPEMNLFTRSDHYSFVKQGIPSIFLVTGITSNDPKDDAENMLMNFLKTHYHSPSDDLYQPFNWTAAYNFTQVNFAIGLEVGNAAQRPMWNADSFFGQTFGKSYNLMK